MYVIGMILRIFLMNEIALEEIDPGFSDPQNGTVRAGIFCFFSQVVNDKKK